VIELQQYLNAHGFTLAASGPGSPGQETDYFGSLTYTALAAFQNAHASALLTPVGLTQGTGYFGPATRMFANDN
jgi:peptidoglycan hydrolase-like protein with peptidoglycan-binding domain